MGYLDNHLNCQCSTPNGLNTQISDSAIASWTTSLKSIEESSDKVHKEKKENVQFYANVFTNKTGWLVYGSRLEDERWIVRDMHGGCWSGDAYEYILKMFENNINLERILYHLKSKCYISSYRKMGYLSSDKFEYRLQDWIVELVRYNEEAKKRDEFYKEVFTGEVNNMGLRIKKTDVFGIDEFKENEKAYDEIRICIDDEMFEKHKDEYGMEPFNVRTSMDGEKYIDVKNETIEYLPKALLIMPNEGYVCTNSVPYEYISNVECTYYLKTE